MSEHDAEWSGEERKMFDALPEELPPPRAAEERIVAALRARGLVGRRAGRRSASPWLAVAAALVLAAAAFAAGRATVRPERPAAGESGAPKFALFLLRGTETVPSAGPEETARVAEYRAWARGLARSGRFVAGEKLEDGGAALASASEPAAPAPVSEDEVRGYFVISAASLDDAVAAARGCPHLKHGGRVLVRPIAKI
jgi:hypothetical protein